MTVLLLSLATQWYFVGWSILHALHLRWAHHASRQYTLIRYLFVLSFICLVSETESCMLVRLLFIQSMEQLKSLHTKGRRGCRYLARAQRSRFYALLI